MAKASSSRSLVPKGSKASRKTALTPELVLLELRLRRLRRLEAKRQCQFDRVHARAAATAAEMTIVLDAVETWVEQRGSAAEAAATVVAQPGRAPVRRTGIRRLVGA